MIGVNLITTEASFAENKTPSIRYRSHQLNISRSFLQQNDDREIASFFTEDSVDPRYMTYLYQAPLIFRVAILAKIRLYSSRGSFSFWKIDGIHKELQCSAGLIGRNYEAFSFEN